MSGIAIEVCAPSKVPRAAGDRVKCDRRDGELLARLLLAGQLRAVAVPDARIEAAREPAGRCESTHCFRMEDRLVERNDRTMNTPLEYRRLARGDCSPDVRRHRSSPRSSGLRRRPSGVATSYRDSATMSCGP